MKTCLLVLVLLLASASARGQIVTVDAADLSYGVAPGSVALLFYGDFGVTELVEASALPLPLELGGVSLKIDGKSAPLFAVAPDRIKFLVPVDAQLGQVEIDFTRPDGRHIGGSVFLSRHGPAVFAVNLYRHNKANVLIVVWANGIQIEQCPNIQLYVGQTAFTPVFVGQSEFAGVEQLNFLVPRSVLTDLPNNNRLRVDDFVSSGLTFPVLK